MKLMSTILLSSAVALGAACWAMAQDTTAQPPGQAQAGPGGPRGPGGPGGPGAPGGPRGPLAGGAAQAGPRSPPSDGGVIGTVDSVSATGFSLSNGAGRKMSVTTSASTTYRDGKRSITASDITPGKTVMVLGIVGFGPQGMSTTVITGDHVIVQPASAVAAAPAAPPAAPQQPGQRPPEKRVGEIPADYVEGGGTVVNGPDANKAAEAAMASEFYGGGLINRVVKQSHGIYECHNITVSWPHHIFVNSDFKVIGAF